MGFLKKIYFLFTIQSYIYITRIIHEVFKDITFYHLLCKIRFKDIIFLLFGRFFNPTIHGFFKDTAFLVFNIQKYIYLICVIHMVFKDINFYYLVYKIRFIEPV